MYFYRAICLALGLYGGEANYNALFNQGRGPIWLVDVRCPTADASLNDCTHRGFGLTQDCSHSFDVSVTCRRYDSNPPVVTDPTLTDGTVASTRPPVVTAPTMSTTSRPVDTDPPTVTDPPDETDSTVGRITDPTPVVTTTVPPAVSVTEPPLTTLSPIVSDGKLQMTIFRVPFPCFIIGGGGGGITV